MLSNRSIPRATVIPVLAYPDVSQAAAWLCDAFGFSVRLRIGNHRVQLNVGDGALVVREMRENETSAGVPTENAVRRSSLQIPTMEETARCAACLSGTWTHGWERPRIFPSA